MTAPKTAETATYHYGFSRRQIETWRHTTNPYTLVIRSPLDPERQTSGMQGAYGVDPHNALARIGRGELEALIWRCLSAHQGTPMTFNELSVRLFDLTADVALGSGFEDALWSLIEQGCVAMTLEAPIVFLRSVDLVDPTLPIPAFTPKTTPVQTSMF